MLNYQKNQCGLEKHQNANLMTLFLSVRSCQIITISAGGKIRKRFQSTSTDSLLCAGCYVYALQMQRSLILRSSQGKRGNR